MWNCREILLCLFIIGYVQNISSMSMKTRLRTYEVFVNSSLQVEKEDKTRIGNWSEEVQVKLIEVTSKYRLEMTKHQQHSFKSRPMNEKWMLCLNRYQNQTTKSEQSYYMRENECLKTASSADSQNRQAFTQIGREIRKWRRTYRYLKNRCHTNHIGNEEETGICLVDYMERDNYSHVFERLINLRLKTLRELREKMTYSVFNLEDCLKSELSKYLEQVRVTMEVLNRCYGSN